MDIKTKIYLQNSNNEKKKIGNNSTTMAVKATYESQDEWGWHEKQTDTRGQEIYAEFWVGHSVDNSLFYNLSISSDLGNLEMCLLAEFIHSLRYFCKKSCWCFLKDKGG